MASFALRAAARHAALPLARNVWVEGAGAGPSLVMLHGVLASGSTYGSLLRRPDCAPRAAHKIAPDLRGHGHSPHARMDEYTYADHVADVAAFLSQPIAPAGHDRRQTRAAGAAGPPVDVCGHSLGGKVAMALALTHPTLIRRLVVVDIAPVAYHQDRRTSRSTACGNAPGKGDRIDVPLRAVRAMSDIERGMLDGHYPQREDIDKALEKHGVDDPRVRMFVATNLVPSTRKGTWTWRCDVHGIRAAMERKDGLGIMGFNFYRDDPADAHSDLALVKPAEPPVFKGPTLFLAGGKSNYIDPERHGRAITSYFPNSSIVTVKHCGHWMQAEDPEAFCVELTRFLEPED